MKPRSVAIVGAAETTELGKIPGMSQIQQLMKVYAVPC